MKMITLEELFSGELEALREHKADIYEVSSGLWITRGDYLEEYNEPDVLDAANVDPEGLYVHDDCGNLWELDI